MFELLHAGFDTLDVAFAGALPAEALEILEQACELAAAKPVVSLVLAVPFPGNF